MVEEPMDSFTELALTADITMATTAAVQAGVAEAQRQASRILGTDGLTADSGRVDPARTDPAHSDPAHIDPAHIYPAQLMAWQLACLRIELAAGWEPIETVVSLRRFGATWAVIGAAAGMTRQSAHERWNAGTLAVLDRYGSGELGGPVADDRPVG
jgi:hypothetical protein